MDWMKKLQQRLILEQAKAAGDDSWIIEQAPRCTGCARGCLLSHPRCVRGAAKAKEKGLL